MASLFKPWITSYRSPPVRDCQRPRCKKRGKCIGHKATRAEAEDESGKLRPGFRRTKERSEKWYARIRYPDGRVTRLPLFTDKAASEVRLAELVTDAEQRETGIRDRFQEHRKRGLAEHLQDFLRFLIAKGNTEAYSQMTYTRAKAVLAGCKFVRMGDLSPSAVVEYLGELKNSGSSIQTSNFYLQAIKSFARWLVKDGRAPDNPLVYLSRGNAKLDVRLERRPLSPAEFESFLKAALEGRPVFGLSGPDREMLYLIAANTGFRANEMASLAPDSFDLDGEPPTVTVEAAYSKRRRKDAQPIRPDLAALIGEWIATKRAASPLWPAESIRGGKFRCWWKDAAEMVRVDLEAAGIPYRDDAGRVFDFHALRHQFISSLAAAGVHPSEAQRLARHSTITLTMDRYTHVGLVDSAAALSKLPGVRSKTKPEAMKATGTTGNDIGRQGTAGAEQAGVRTDLGKRKSTEDEKAHLPFPERSYGEKNDPQISDRSGFLNRRSQVRILPGVVAISPPWPLSGRGDRPYTVFPQLRVARQICSAFVRKGVHHALHRRD